jgi:rhodanese-related sulfurtransferase
MFIATAKFADYFNVDFHTKLSKQLDENERVYLYCRNGSRSVKLAKILQEKGYKVYNAIDGYNQWELKKLRLSSKKHVVYSHIFKLAPKLD